MKLGIMQPYFAPYIGYWQLMNAVDEYVIFDDVNYINRGWINRNRILVNNSPQYLNVPLLGASQNKLINEVMVNTDLKLVEKNLRTLRGAYGKAPYYKEVFPVIESILRNEETNLAKYIAYSMEVFKDFLGITTSFIMSSSIDKNNALRGQDKVLDICERLGATEYYNAIGGRELYFFKNFQDRGFDLKFLKSNAITYDQFGGEFQSGLSILDVMMFNPLDKIKEMLLSYELVTSDEQY